MEQIAFDTVDHNILIQKLNKINVHPNSTKWFETNRQPKVTLMGHKSDSKIVKCLMPQGFILGPLLFITYMNDFTEYVTDSNVKLYADDIVLILEQSHMLNIRLDLDVVAEWLKANKLSLDSNKTFFG